MALSEFDHALLSSLAYSEAFEPDNPKGPHIGADLASYFQSQLDDNGNVKSNSVFYDAPAYWTQDEWHAVLRAAANSEGLKGYKIDRIAENSFDGSEMICLTNPSTSEACFVFEGTSTDEGWAEDALILATGTTDSQNEAMGFVDTTIAEHDAAGYTYSYEADGHSKGANQAAIAAKDNPRINSVYAFDGPGDDYEHIDGDPRIHCINNENDIVSALLYPWASNETLLRPHSDDPNHIDGLLAAHSPANLFNFGYVTDESGNKVLACTGLAEDVSSEGGSRLRQVIRGFTMALGLQGDELRNAEAQFLSRILPVAMGDDLSIGKVLDIGMTGAMMVAHVKLGLLRFTVAEVTNVLSSLFIKASDFFINSMVSLAQAAAYTGKALRNAMHYIAEKISNYYQVAKNAVLSWVAKTINGVKRIAVGIGNAIKSFGDWLGKILFGWGGRVYDFSTAKLNMLEVAHRKQQAVVLFDPNSWMRYHGAERFMNRLSLSGASASVNSAFASENAYTDELIQKVNGAFNRAADEDEHFAAELSGMANSVEAAMAAFA